MIDMLGDVVAMVESIASIVPSTPPPLDELSCLTFSSVLKIRTRKSLLLIPRFD